MTQRLKRLMALAAGAEEDITKLPSGVWRRFCPSCRGEFPAQTQACPACVETLSETINEFNASVAEVMSDNPDKTLETAQEEVFWGMLDDLSRARTEGNAKEARRIEKKLRLMKAYRTKQDFDAQLAEVLEGVKDPEERQRISKKMRELMTDEIQQQLDMAIGKLPKPVEVAPTYSRKLQDYVRRARDAGKPVTTTYAAAKFLGFGDKDSFITFAVSKGVRPVMALDVPGSGPQDMPEPKPGGMEQVRRMPPRIFHYAAWNVKDLLNLRKLLKKQRGIAETEPMTGGLQQEISSLENQLRAAQIRLEKVDEMERSHPEKMSEIHKLRNKATTEIESLEKRLADKRQKLEELRGTEPTS